MEPTPPEAGGLVEQLNQLVAGQGARRALAGRLEDHTAGVARLERERALHVVAVAPQRPAAEPVEGERRHTGL
ncbi:MAG: hypothetical protein LBV34_19435, partial [Nocardiopsaceae bacterium]|nr:hypothetical protein [Nocardiopsaceae bacterium]